MKKIIGSFSANTELLYLQQFFEVRKIVYKKCSRFSAAFFCPFFRLLFTFNRQFGIIVVISCLMGSLNNDFKGIEYRGICYY